MASEKDAIEQMIEILEDALPDLRWDRDALDMDAREETGAVEVTGEMSADWADGHPVDCIMGADVWICVNGSGLEYLTKVAEALMQYDDEVGLITWSQPERHFLYDIGKVAWRWRVNFWEPMTAQETADEEAVTEDG